LKDETGFVNPLLNIDRRVQQFTDIYVKGETWASGIFDVVKLKVQVCGFETVLLEDDPAWVFTVKSDVEKGPIDLEALPFFISSDPNCPVYSYDLTMD